LVLNEERLENTPALTNMRGQKKQIIGLARFPSYKNALELAINAAPEKY